MNERKKPKQAQMVGITDWARWPEVLGYAKRHDIRVDEAIRRLVNAGLSAQSESYVPAKHVCTEYLCCD